MSLNDTPPSTEIVQVPQEFGLSLRQVKQDQPIDLSGTAQSPRRACAFSFGLARSDFCHPDPMRMNVITTVRLRLLHRPGGRKSGCCSPIYQPHGFGLGAIGFDCHVVFFHGALRAVGSTGQLTEY
jgi:hypothetical protein